LIQLFKQEVSACMAIKANEHNLSNKINPVSIFKRMPQAGNFSL